MTAMRSVLATRVDRGLAAFTICMAFAAGLLAGLQSIEVDRLAATRAPAHLVVAQLP